MLAPLAGVRVRYTWARWVLLLALFALPACEDPVEARCEPGAADCRADDRESEPSLKGEGLDLRPGAPSVPWTVAATQAVPPDFAIEVAVEGFNLPTDVEFLPDGRILVAELRGTIRMAENGVVIPGFFLDFQDRVNKCCNRGLLGIAADPDWPSQPYVYLLYSYDPPEVNQFGGNAGPDGEGHRVSRLTRVTADASNNYETIVPGSEVIVAGANSTWANIGDPSSTQTNLSAGWTCYEDGIAFGTPVQDCIPADGFSHSVGTVAFGTDGSLFFGNGDAASYQAVDERATRSLEPTSMAGKIFRIDPNTGNGLPSNPFWDGDPTSNASKVYQMGLRNPYRFTIDPFTNEPWIGDVGWVAWEELNHGGLDYGWPCYEGGEGVNEQSQDGYQNLGYCQSYYGTANATPGTVAWFRRGTGGAALGGPVYTGSTYPAEFQGATFFGDYVKQWLKYRKPDGTIVDFADALGPVVDVAQGPDGNLYYLHYGFGWLYRFIYTGDPPVQNGLVLHLPFDEGSGTLTADASGQGNDGTLLNGPTWIGSPLGTAIDFDGVNDVVEVPSDPSLDVTDEITLAAWVNARSFENWEGIITKGRSKTTYGLNLWGDGTIRLTANWGSPPGGVGIGAWNSTMTVTPNEWHHVAATYDGQRIRFYIDGVEDPRRPSPTLVFGVVDEPLTVGGDLPGLPEYTDGSIDGVRVYNRALSLAEIQDLASTGGGNNPPTIENPGDQVGVVGDNPVLFLQGSDPDGDFLNFSATGLPPSLQLRPRVGEISGPLTEAGVYNVTATVTDGVASASTSFTWTVTDPGPGPGPLDPVLWMKLDEGSGTTAADSSGYVNDGTLNGPVWTSGQFDGALEFDGVDDLVEVPSDPSLDITDDITLTAWIYVRSFENWEGIITKGRTKTAYGLNVWGDQTIRFTVNWGSPSGGVGIGAWNSRLKITPNTWHHVAVTYDGRFNFFVDGVEDSYKPGPTVKFGVIDEPLTLGGDLPGQDEYLDGSIDDARVYPRALTAAEIQTLFAGGRVP